MIFPLHALLVSDTPAEPVLDALRGAGYDPETAHVSTSQALAAALDGRSWNVVLFCHDATSLSVWDVLGRVQQLASCPQLLVFGDTFDEAEAVALIREGVRDVIRTNDQHRLGVAVAKAVRSQREARAAQALPGASVEVAFQALAEHTPVGFYRSTEDGRFLYANRALARMLGHATAEDLLGESVRSIGQYPREDFLRAIVSAGEVRAFERSWTRADGALIVTRENARAVRGDDGALLYYEGTIEDLTHERRALYVEQRRARQYEAIARFNGAVDAADGEEAFEAALLRVVEEAFEADAAVLLQRSDEGVEAQAWSMCIADGIETSREREIRQMYPVGTEPILVHDEEVLDGESLIEPMRDAMRRVGMRALCSIPLVHEGQSVGALVALFREPQTFQSDELRRADAFGSHVASALTRWQAERDRRARDASFQSIVATTGQVFYRLRFGDTVYDYVGDSIEPLTGYSAEALEKRGGIEAITEHREILEGEQLDAEENSAEARCVSLYQLRTASGELRWVEDSAVAWVDATGAIVGTVGVLQDVTARRGREEEASSEGMRSLAQQKALRHLSTLDADTEEVLQRTTEVAAETVGAGRVALWLLSEVGHELRCQNIFVRGDNRHHVDEAFRGDAVADIVEMLGHQRVLATTDVLNKPLSERIGLDVYHARNEVRAVLAASILRAGRVVGFVAFEHLGEPRAWTTDERDFAGAVADLIALTLERGKRAQAEVTLRECESRYRAISSLASDYAHVLKAEPDGTLRLVWANEDFERISGYSSAEFQDLDGLKRMVHEDDQAALDAEIERLRAGATIEIEMRIVTKSGRERWIWHRSRPVKDRQGRLEHVYSTGRDITERKRVEKALVAAREEAEALARRKSDFLASMSHEIRTPLTGIIGFAGVLAEEGDGEHREFARLIEQNGRRLVGTLNSVLDLAKLESNGLDLIPEPLDVIEEVRQVVLLLSPLADGKGIKLGLRTEEAELIAPLDIVCLHRILNNLVGNAIKFTDAGHVTIEVVATESYVQIDVVDSGIGIDAEFLPHLFDEFRQEAQEVQEMKESGREGSGLGLAITKKLVTTMGGRITVESTKGEGSRFSLTFPMTRVVESHREASGSAASRAMLAPDDGFLLTDLRTNTTEDDSSDHARSDGDRGHGFLSLNDVSLHVAGEGRDDGGSAHAADKNPRILVIEDKLGVGVALKRKLSDTFAVDTATEARDALDRMGRTAYDAIVLDVNLGGSRCGVDVLRVARTLMGYEYTVAVALLSDGASAETMREAGFDQCVSKPFTEEKLLAALGGLAKGDG